MHPCMRSLTPREYPWPPPLSLSQVGRSSRRVAGAVHAQVVRPRPRDALSPGSAAGQAGPHGTLVHAGTRTRHGAAGRDRQHIQQAA